MGVVFHMHMLFVSIEERRDLCAMASHKNSQKGPLCVYQLINVRRGWAMGVGRICLCVTSCVQEYSVHQSYRCLYLKQPLFHRRTHMSDHKVLFFPLCWSVKKIISIPGIILYNAKMTGKCRL
jgi:hypothetical protein